MASSSFVSEANDNGKSQAKRRMWTLKEEEVLVTTLESLVTRGFKADNGFRSGYQVQLENAMQKVFPGTDLRAEPHINSKIHAWKRTYGSLVSMMVKSGVGYNDSAKMIEVTDEADWDSACKMDNTAAKLRYKTFPFYKRWIYIFGKDRATGETAEDARNADAVALDGNGNPKTPMSNLNDVDYVINGETDSPSSVSKPVLSQSQSKRSRKKQKNGDDEFNSLVDVVTHLAEGTHEKLGEIVKKMGYDFEMGKKTGEIYQHLLEMRWLGPQERIKALNFISKDNKSIEIMCAMTPDDRSEMVRMIVSGQM